MQQPTPIRVFAILLLLPLLPICAFALNGQSEVVFLTGSAVFLINVLLLVGSIAVLNMPPAGSVPIVKPIRFTIRDLLCVTMFVMGTVAFFISGFECEAAERASRPNPLPSSVLLRFVWQMEFGLVLLTIVAIVWIRSAFKRQERNSCVSASPAETCSG